MSLAGRGLFGFKPSYPNSSSPQNRRALCTCGLIRLGQLGRCLVQATVSVTLTEKIDKGFNLGDFSRRGEPDFIAMLA